MTDKGISSSQIINGIFNKAGHPDYEAVKNYATEASVDQVASTDHSAHNENAALFFAGFFQKWLGKFLF